MFLWTIFLESNNQVFFPLDISGLTDEDIQYLQQTIGILKRKRL